MKILVPRFDTYGDLILVSGFLEGLRCEWPDSEIHLLVRRQYLDLQPLFPPSLRWHGTAMEPRLVLPRKLRADDDIVDLLGEHWDLMLGTTYDKTWLDDEIAADLSGKGVRCIQIAKAGAPPVNDNVETVFVPQDAPEGRKYQQLFRVITNSAACLSRPVLDVPVAEQQHARICLEDRRLTPGEFVSCVPGGGMNNPLKIWNPSNFAKCIVRLESEQGIPVLLIGHDSESELIETTRRLAANLGATPRVWTGFTGQIGLVAALVHSSRLYLGNDTGTLHIAQGVGVPWVSVFGGGHWPRFVPPGPGIAVRSPWDCYGCEWHCWYGQAHCIGSIDEDDVSAALVRVLKSPPSGCEVIDSTRRNFPAVTDLKRASQQFVAISQDAKTLGFTRRELQGVLQREAGTISQLRAASEHTAAVEMRLRQSEVETQAIRAQIAQAEEARMKAADAGAALENAAREREAETQAMRERVAWCETQIDSVNDALRETELKRQSLESESAALLEQVRAADAAGERLNLELINLQQRVAESDNRAASSSENVGALNVLLSDAQYRCEALEREIERIRLSAAAEADAESARYAAEVVRLTAALEGVRRSPFEWLVTSRSVQSDTFEFLEPVAVSGLISVVIPAYNATGFLEQAVKSVWEQQPGDFELEILICDDGSTDGTGHLARDLAKRSPVPIRVLQHEGERNLGVSATRNHAIRHARGEFISLLDADDHWLPQKTAVQTEYLSRHQDVVCLCSLGWNRNFAGELVAGWNGTNLAGDYSGVPAPADFTPPYAFHQLLKGDPIVNSTVMIRRDAIRMAGGYTDVMAHQAEDWLLFLKIAVYSPIHLIAEPLVNYIIHPGSYTTRYFTDGLAYGARTECMFQLLHWMLQKPEHRELAKWVYRRQLPHLLAAHGAAYKLIESYYRSKNGNADDLFSYEAHLCDVYAKLQRLDYLEHYYEHIEAQINLARRIPGMTGAYHAARSVWRLIRQ